MGSRSDQAQAILFDLGRASGTVGNPINKSNHAVAILLCRELFFAIKESKLFELLIVREELSGEDNEAMERFARQGLAEIAREYREKLEQITPEMLEAEAEAAVQLGEREHTNNVEQGQADGGTSTVTLPQRPKVYLRNWPEILDVLQLPENDSNRSNVRRSNEKFTGPIVIQKQGSQPFVEKLQLLEWWNELEKRVQEAHDLSCIQPMPSFFFLLVFAIQGESWNL